MAMRYHALLTFTFPLCLLCARIRASYVESEDFAVAYPRVHFVGRFGDEAQMLQLAHQLEQARPWSDRRPSWIVQSV